MKVVARVLIVSTLMASYGLASAGPRYYEPPPPPFHHHHHHDGPHLGKWALGLAIAVPLIAIASHANRAPEPVYMAPPPPPPAPLPMAQPVYVPARPAAVVYPRNGQSYQQQEFDQRECNGWATTQQAAMADASVFHRAVEACMDGRGYTMR